MKNALLDRRILFYSSFFYLAIFLDLLHLLFINCFVFYLYFAFTEKSIFLLALIYSSDRRLRHKWRARTSVRSAFRPAAHQVSDPVNTLTSVHGAPWLGRPPCKPEQRPYNSSAAVAAAVPPRERSQLQRRKKRKMKKDTRTRLHASVHEAVRIDTSVHLFV